MKLLDIHNLSFTLKTYDGNVTPVRDVSFSVERGEIVAVVGESGCGKTMTCLSMLKLFDPHRGRLHPESRISFEEARIDGYSEKQMSQLRGRDIGMVFQDPAKSLNPTQKVGRQIDDVLRFHTNLGRKERRERVIRLLDHLGVSDSEARIGQYPHELSGGLRQRVVIASAIVCQPKLLVADEPTTALDPTIQAQILCLLRDLREQQGMSILLITHNLGIVAQMADRILIMYGGHLVESGSVQDIFYRPAHPYTRSLIDSVPQKNMSRSRRLVSIPGTPPDLRRAYTGCPFLNRCPRRMQICAQGFPDATQIAGDHQCHCYLYHPDRPNTI